MMDISELNQYSRIANTVSFILTTAFALQSIFSKHFEMPNLFKGIIITLILISAFLFRYTFYTLYENGCKSMVYTLIFHTILFVVTVIGAKAGAYK